MRRIALRLGDRMCVPRFPGRLAGLLLALGLSLGGAVPGVQAATSLPPPNIIAVDPLSDGSVNVRWKFVANRTPGPGGSSKLSGPAEPWGYRFNVTIEQTGERIHSETRAPSQPDDFDTNERTYHPGKAEFFAGHGSLDETRYCVRMQTYVGNGTDAGSAFSEESKPVCVGTQKILIETPAQGPSPFEPAAPPPPTKPDLSVTRVSTGPATVFDGATANYEIALWNDGTPAKDSAQVLLGILGPIEPVELLETPDGFNCELGQYGYDCKGSLGGVDNPLGTRGALFRVQVRGNGSGSAAVYGSANHDQALDEMTSDNNLKLLDVTVK